MLVSCFLCTWFSKFSTISWKGFKNRRKYRKVMGPPSRTNCCFYFRYLMKEQNVLDEVWDHFVSSPRPSLLGCTSIWSVCILFCILCFPEALYNGILCVLQNWHTFYHTGKVSDSLFSLTLAFWEPFRSLRVESIHLF